MDKLMHGDMNHMLQSGFDSLASKFGAKVSDIISPGEGEDIGINWGQGHTSVDAPPDLVVARMKELGIKRVRLYATLSPATEKALANSGISVTITMWPDASLTNREPTGGPGSPYKGEAAAKSWVQQHVVGPASRGCAVNFVLVGNEPSWDKPYDNAMLPALANLHDALISLGLKGRVQTGVPLAASVMANAWPPSSACFQPRIDNQIKTLCKHLRILGSPFIIHLYPYFAAAQAHSSGKLGPLEYYFFSPGNKSEFVDPKSHLRYYNSFDASLDGVYYALEKIGYSDLEVIVGESGWPTAGAPLATVPHAEKYNKALMDHLRKGHGTPKKPGKAPKTILFEILDSDKKAGIEAHWGMHVYDPHAKVIKPKYNIGAFSAGGVYSM